MDVQLTFSYDGRLNEKLDEHLRWLGEQFGFEWYAQGTNLKTDRRDLAFKADYADDAFNQEVKS